MNIVIVGAGATGISFSAELVEAGHSATLLEQENHRQNLDEIKQAGAVTRIGYGPQGKTALPKLETNPACISQANVIFIAAVANRHAELCTMITPHLRDGQTVLFFNGNCGSILLRNMLHGKAVVLGEMPGTHASTRYLGNGIVHYASPSKVPKPAVAFPASDNQKLANAINPCFSVICGSEACPKNVLESTLTVPNATVHLISSVACISAMEHSQDFRLYRDGMSPALIKLIEAVQRERDAIFSKFGFRGMDFTPTMQKCVKFDAEPDLKLSGFRLTSGPNCVSHRYFSEDAFAGDTLLISMGELVGVKTPVLRAAVAIASVLNETDYLTEGLTLSRLGLNGLTPDEINTYLAIGR